MRMQDSARMSSRKRTAILISIGLAFVYLYAFPYLEQIHNANELPRIYLVEAIVERGKFEIDQEVRRYGAVVDLSEYGGHLYSNKAPGLSLIGVPVYLAQRAWHRLIGRPPPTLRERTFALRLFCVTLPSLLFLSVVWRLTGLYSDSHPARQAALISYALGTQALPFSLLYIAHQPSAILCGTAFALLAAAPSALGLAWAGLCLGGAVMVDYQAAFCLLPLAFYALWRVRPIWRLSFAVAGAVPPLLLLGIYHRACFGSVLSTGYAHSVTPAFRVLHGQGILGLTRPSLRNFTEGFFALDNGLFALAPWLLLGVAGLLMRLRRGQERRGEAAAAAAVVVSMSLFLVSITFARVGWSMGPRYITIAVPFLAAPAAAAMEAAARRTVLLLGATALRVASSLIYVGSALVFPLWPDKLRNPVVEIAWPLVRDGFAPYNLGSWVGLPMRLAMIPVFAVALLLVLAPARPHLLRLGSLVLGTALVLCFWLGPRSPGADSTGVARWIESIWEPRPAAIKAPPSLPTPAASPASPRGARGAGSPPPR
jgi:hypothetical protein